MRRFRSTIIGSLLVPLAVGCNARPTPEAGALETAVAGAAFTLLTQTAAAASPTPVPPTPTLTPEATATESLTPTSSEPLERPRTTTFAACWLGGPGSPYALDSNIKQGKGVEFLGIGSASGWYVIRNPYFHRPCWIMASDLKIFEGFDVSTFPVMTPGIPLMGQ